MHPEYPPWMQFLSLGYASGKTATAEDIWVHILLLGVVYPILNI